MKTKIFLLLITWLCCISCVFSQGFLKGKYPKDLNKTTLLVQKIQNGKPKWLPDYHKKQYSILKKYYQFPYELITVKQFDKYKDAKYKNVDKYRYILIATVQSRYVDGNATDSDRKSTRLNSSHIPLSRMPSSA